MKRLDEENNNNILEILSDTKLFSPKLSRACTMA